MKKLVIALVLIFYSQVAYGAIAFDTSTTAQTVNPQPLNFNITGVTSNNTVLICVQTTNGGFTSTGVTAGGASMTLLTSGTDGAGPTQYMYYKVNPGSGTIAISMGATGSAVSGSCATYTGVDQVNPIDATSTTASVTTTSFTSTITTLTDQAWVITSARLASGATITAGANTVVRTQPEVTFFGGGALWDSGAGRSTGSNSLNVTSASQLYGVGLNVALKPSGGAVVSTPKTLGFFKLLRFR